MNSLSKTRGTAYATGILVGLASLAKLLGVADFNPATGMFDPHPFSIYILVGLFTPVVTGALALLAVVKGWGQKEIKIKVVENVVISQVKS